MDDFERKADAEKTLCYFPILDTISIFYGFILKDLSIKYLGL